MDAWKAVDRANPEAPSFLNLIQFEGAWQHYEEVEKQKVKEEQKRLTKQDELITGERIDKDVLKKMFVRNDEPNR